MTRLAYASSDEVKPDFSPIWVKAIKSLFGFARELGYLSLDVARAAKTPKVKNTLGEMLGHRRVLLLSNFPRSHFSPVQAPRLSHGQRHEARWGV